MLKKLNFNDATIFDLPNDKTSSSRGELPIASHSDRENARIQLEKDFSNFLNSTRRNKASDVQDQVKLTNELNKLYYQNKQKQRKLQYLNQQRTQSMGDLDDQSIFSFKSSAPVDIEESLLRLKRKLKDLSKKEFLIDEEEMSLDHMYERDKAQNLWNSVRLDDLKLKHSKVTMNITDIKEGRAHAIEHFNKINLKLTKTNNKIIKNRNKLNSRLEEKENEKKIIDDEVELMSVRITDEIIKSNKNSDRKRDLLQNIEMRLQVDRDENKFMRDYQVSLNRQRKHYVALKAAYDESSIFGKNDFLPDDLQIAAVPLIVKRYKQMLYKENHLQIMYVDLSNQENALKEEEDGFKEVLVKMKALQGQTETQQNHVMMRINQFAKNENATSYNTMLQSLDLIQDKSVSMTYDFTYHIYQHVLDLIRRGLATLHDLYRLDAGCFADIYGTYNNTIDKFEEICYGIIPKHRYENDPLAPKRRRKLLTDNSSAYVAYTEAELIAIYRKMHKSDIERAQEFAQRVLEIPIYMYFLGEEDFIQFLNAHAKENPIPKMGYLLSVAFKNQQTKFGSMFDIFSTLIRKVKAGAGKVSHELSTTRMTDEQTKTFHLFKSQDVSAFEKIAKSLTLRPRRTRSRLTTYSQGTTHLLQKSIESMSSKPNYKGSQMCDRLKSAFDHVLENVMSAASTTGPVTRKPKTAMERTERIKSEYGRVNSLQRALQKPIINDKQEEIEQISDLRNHLKENQRTTRVSKSRPVSSMRKCFTERQLHSQLATRPATAKKTRAVLKEVAAIQTEIRGLRVKQRLASAQERFKTSNPTLTPISQRGSLMRPSAPLWISKSNVCL